MMKPCKQGKLWIGVVSVLIIWSITPAEAKCATLPSGRCWVNCAQEIFDIICNHVTVDMVISDISVFTGTSQQLRLYIWSSPNIQRLSASVFSAVAEQIVLLDLQDVIGLDTFPELKDLVNLKRLNIWNSPKLCRLALELLPLGIWKIAINKVCISYLENDFVEVPSLPDLEVLNLRNLTIKGLQHDFLKLFPNLRKFEVSNCTFQLNYKHNEFFETRTIHDFKLIQNDFTFMHKENATDFLGNLLKSMKMPEGSLVDLSFNNLEINDVVIEGLQSLSLVSHLTLRGNKILMSDNLPGFLAYFTGLQHLDLGHTQLYPVKGLLEGLPSVTTLLLDHNNLSGVNKTDIFDGCSATKLSTLDLSYNNIENLALGNSFERVANQIRDLNLDGNNLKVFENDQIDSASQKFSTNFAGLRNLSLAYNKLERFRGVHLQQLVNLEHLDLSCNFFGQITKEMFTGLNVNLTTLNISFGIRPPQDSPKADLDAFSTLPRLKSLSLGSASFKTWVFRLFANMSIDAKESLKELYLDGNDISFIRNNTIPLLPNLRLLSLQRNGLQSISAGSFIMLPELRSLQLGGNRIISLGADDLNNGGGQLKKLEDLDLSNNGLATVVPGAFDLLPQLKSLMLGWNPRLEIQDVFTGNGGQKLVYLGIQGYNHSCLHPKLFSQLQKLRWILPDVYNAISAYPDARVMKVDPYLQSLIKACNMGQDLPDHENNFGMRDFVGVTIHDTDEGDGPQYPIMVGWLPLNYCPADDYVTALTSSICSKEYLMRQTDTFDS